MVRVVDLNFQSRALSTVGGCSLLFLAHLLGCALEICYHCH